MRLSIKLTGVSPLVLHNNQTVNPLNPLAQKLKAITKKRSKTEADFKEIERLEFIAGLYFDDELGPYLPQANLRKMLVLGGRKDKRGKDFESGLFVLAPAKIEYDGPRDIESLYKLGDPFVFTSPVKVGTSTLIRTRPRFKGWSCRFDIEIETSLLDLETVSNALKKAGLAVGIGDGRSIGYGRFTSELSQVGD